MVSNPDDLPYIQKGLPPGYVPKNLVTAKSTH